MHVKHLLQCQVDIKTDTKQRKTSIFIIGEEKIRKSSSCLGGMNVIHWLFVCSNLRNTRFSYIEIF